MDTKRLLLSAAAAIALCACDKWESPPDDPGVALARAQFLAAPALQVHGATLNVPSKKYPTIGAALSSAKRGDQVRVAAGTYRECPVLVDGVTLVGQPGATIDGASCDPAVLGVVSADASIVHGATVQGFTIVDAKRAGVYMNRATGVHVLDMMFSGNSALLPREVWMVGSTGSLVARCRFEGGGVLLDDGSAAVLSDLEVSNSPLGSVRSVRSSFLLERSRIIGSGSTGVSALTGSRAVLVGNEIQGREDGIRIDSGFLSDGAPSQAWLLDNYVHGNVGVGMRVIGKGSWAYGTGNRYEENDLSGVHVTGGATYVGLRESMTANTWDGLVVLGCELFCNDAECSPPVIIQERSLVVLNDFEINGNMGDGLWSACDAQVNLAHGSIAHNVGRGAVVASTWDFGGGNQSYAPSELKVEWTVFDTNRVGAVAREDSRLILGTLDEPGMNSFLGNTALAIRNLSTGPVSAQLNWFGTTDAAVIAGSLFGNVTYEPFLTHEP